MSPCATGWVVACWLRGFAGILTHLIKFGVRTWVKLVKFGLGPGWLVSKFAGFLRRFGRMRMGLRLDETKDETEDQRNV